MNTGLESARDEVRRVILDGAKRAFFEAMLAGYAGGEKVTGLKVKVEKEKCHKEVTTWRGSYKVIDEWRTTPYSDSSTGTTTILFKDGRHWHPVWWMSYCGRYPKRVIPFLKEALVAAYKKGEFCGGRGLERFEDKSADLLYSNHTEFRDFSMFSGCEHITTAGSYEGLGHHCYMGMSLLG